MVDLRLGDCLEVMHTIPDGSVDMILADLPYGTTACKWDTVIDLPSLWKHYKRIIKRNGAIVLTASQPFTTTLIASNMGMFKYAWVWDKRICSGTGSVKYRPMGAHEDVLVFAQGVTNYNPQMEARTEAELKRLSHKTVVSSSRSDQRPSLVAWNRNRYDHTSKYPNTVIRIMGVMNRSYEKVAHPTQKPVALMEYLIKTYTNEGETVLDNTMGSGTTGVACVNTNRHFIGIEKDEGYFRVATERIEKAANAYRQMEMTA